MRKKRSPWTWISHGTDDNASGVLYRISAWHKSTLTPHFSLLRLAAGLLVASIVCLLLSCWLLGVYVARTVAACCSLFIRRDFLFCSNVNTTDQNDNKEKLAQLKTIFLHNKWQSVVMAHTEHRSFDKSHFSFLNTKNWAKKMWYFTCFQCTRMHDGQCTRYIPQINLSSSYYSAWDGYEIDSILVMVKLRLFCCCLLFLLLLSTTKNTNCVYRISV